MKPPIHSLLGFAGSPIYSSQSCYLIARLTIHSSRRRFAARLNSGVRLFGNTPIGFKAAHAASKAHPFLQGKSAAQSHLRQVKRTRRCGSKRLSVGQKHWFVAADRSNFWVLFAPNSFATHAVAAEALALGYNGSRNRLQPNQSLKLMSLRGAVFCGSVYHNAAPLRATA